MILRKRNRLWDDTIPFPEASVSVASIVLASSATLTYAASLYGNFVFDDQEAIVNNPDVTSANVTLRDIFTHDFWGSSMRHNASHKSYRPLTVLLFRALYHYYGHLSPYPYHVANIVLHVLISFETYFAYSLILEGRGNKLPFFCSLLFSVHPVHTESIAGIVGQAELLSALFAFLAFIIYAHGCFESRSLTSSITLTFLSCLCSIIAMLCKEQGIAIIGMMSVYDIVIVNKLSIAKAYEMIIAFGKLLYFFRPNNWKLHHSQTLSSEWRSFANVVYPIRNLTIRHIILVVLTAAALYGRWLVMGTSLPVFQEVDNPTSFQDDFMIRVLNYSYIYLMNICIFLCPIWLCFDWSMGCIPLIKEMDINSDVRVTVVIIFWLTISLMVIGVFLKSGYVKRLLVMALSSAFILFLPASNIFFNVGFVIAERVLYMPSFGCILLIGVGAQRLSNFISAEPYLHIGLRMLIILFTLRSIQRTSDWKSEQQLFESALSVCPLNAKVHYNLGKSAADRGDRWTAVRRYEEAIRLNSNYGLAMNNLANIYRDEGNMTRAERLLTKAIAIKPTFSTAWMNLGIVYSGMSLLDKAEKCYLKALQLRRRYPDCYYNLGNLYLEQGKNELALSAWRNATYLKPTHRIAWSNMIVMLDSMGLLEEAVRTSHNALSFLPNEPFLHFNLANVLGKMKKYKDSEKHFQQAIKLNSTVPTFHYNLGVLYHRWNRLCNAKYHYERANQLDPKSKARYQLDVLNESGKVSRCLMQ